VCNKKFIKNGAELAKHLENHALEGELKNLREPSGEVEDMATMKIEAKAKKASNEEKNAVETDDYECAACNQKIVKAQKFCSSCGGELAWTV